MSSVSISKQETDYRTYGSALITIVLWASAFAGIRVGLESYSPTSLALLRYLVASLVLLIIAIIRRRPVPQLRDIPAIALLGFLGFSAYNVALNMGEIAVSAGVASFIVASAPIHMALFAVLFLKERLRKWGWLGIFVSFGGIALISFSTVQNFDINPAALLILAAAMMQAAYSTFQKPLLEKYSPIDLVSYAVWAGTLFLLTFLPDLLHEIPSASRASTMAVIYMGILPGAIAYASWSVVLARMPASVAGSLLYLVPPIAVLIAWLWLGEVPTLLAFVGGLLVFVGVWLVNRYGR